MNFCVLNIYFKYYVVYDLEIFYKTERGLYVFQKTGIKFDLIFILGQDDSFVSGVFGKNVNVIGNRLDVHLGEESHLVMGTVEPLPATDLNSSVKLPDIPKYDISLIKR